MVPRVELFYLTKYPYHYVGVFFFKKTCTKRIMDASKSPTGFFEKESLHNPALDVQHLFVP